MKVVEITGPRQAGTVDRPDPTPASDIVAVEIRVTPMCKEFTGYRDGKMSDRLGHEAAGVVVDAAGSTRVKVGQRVAVMPQYGCGVCRYCTAGEHIHCLSQRDVLAETGSDYGTATYAQVILKPDWLLLPIPDQISLKHASLACCGLGPGFNAMQRMRVDALDTVLVSGCGPVGIGAIVHAKARGARVLALEVNPYRAGLAGELGADEVFDPRDDATPARILERTDGWGVDAAVDTTNVAEAVALMQGSVRRRGRAAFVAWSGSFALNRIVPQGLEAHGCWHWNHQVYGQEMLTTIARSGPALDRMVTHTFDMDRISDAFDVQVSGDCGKVLLYPHGEDAAA